MDGAKRPNVLQGQTSGRPLPPHFKVTLVVAFSAHDHSLSRAKEDPYVLQLYHAHTVAASPHEKNESVRSPPCRSTSPRENGALCAVVKLQAAPYSDGDLLGEEDLNIVCLI